MSRSYLSILTKPAAAYIPSKFVPGLSIRRRKSNTSAPKPVPVADSKIHQRDLDFIASIWTVEESKCDSSSDESKQEEDALDPNSPEESKTEHTPAVTTLM